MASKDKSQLKKAKNYPLPKPPRSLQAIKESVKSKLAHREIEKIEKVLGNDIAKEHLNHARREKHFGQGLSNGLHKASQGVELDRQTERNIKQLERQARERAERAVKMNFDLKPLYRKARLALQERFKRAKDRGREK